MSWRAFCSHSVPQGAKFLFHPNEAHSHGMTSWLKSNFHDVVQLNPGWKFTCREVLTNNPHVSMTYAQGHTRSIALYNASEEEVETAMKTLVEYGMNYAPRGGADNLTHEPNVVSYSPATLYVSIQNITTTAALGTLSDHMSWAEEIPTPGLGALHQLIRRHSTDRGGPGPNALVLSTVVGVTMPSLWFKMVLNSPLQLPPCRLPHPFFHLY
eukprot:TRINITY_DN1_c0_g2_i3.p1 TRINITY_DN1_c0_g2~~TRINITY_DN1_c0_g2_i3.p1  ORF type:complete len:212 (+),score=10.86 TRINITY_DN1_c0_g2_i3:43-678(+)